MSVIGPLQHENTDQFGNDSLRAFCRAEVNVGLEEAIERDLEGWLDFLDSLEAADENEGYYLDDDDRRWELGPLMETNYRVLHAGLDPDLDEMITIEITGYRQATPVEDE